MRYEDAVAHLGARQPEHMPGPSLDRIRALVDYLDHPELTYPTIHVTGTNGKSTAARSAAAVACGHELTAGVYLSPHLVDVTERFNVCGRDMTRGEFAAEWARLAPYLELVDGLGMGEVTYFEAVTALAFLWFADRPVGLGVFEVGMGGSWDATNLVMGDVAVITPIGMDHVAELGPTLADIATEKAGIIKDARVAVVRAQDAEAALVLARRADEVGATLLHEGADWEVEEPLLAVGRPVVHAAHPSGDLRGPLPARVRRLRRGERGRRRGRVRGAHREGPQRRRAPRRSRRGPGPGQARGRRPRSARRPRRGAQRRRGARRGRGVRADVHAGNGSTS